MKKITMFLVSLSICILMIVVSSCTKEDTAIGISSIIASRYIEQQSQQNNVTPTPVPQPDPTPQYTEGIPVGVWEMDESDFGVFYEDGTITWYSFSQSANTFIRADSYIEYTDGKYIIRDAQRRILGYINLEIISSDQIIIGDNTVLNRTNSQNIQTFVSQHPKESLDYTRWYYYDGQHDVHCIHFLENNSFKSFYYDENIDYATFINRYLNGNIYNYTYTASTHTGEFSSNFINPGDFSITNGILTLNSVHNRSYIQESLFYDSKKALTGTILKMR